MKKRKDIKRALQEELKNTLSNSIWKNDDGVYEVFGNYKVSPHDTGFMVTTNRKEIGIFSSTKTALSWCIADKYSHYELARELMYIDLELINLNNDISVRMSLVQQSEDSEYRDLVSTKMEPKIQRRIHLQHRLVRCVNIAKYWQQRGFLNETARPC
jgi:hypothetical protein